MKKRILLALALFLGLGSIMYAAGASSPITGFSWDNVRKVVRFMTSDGNEITVPQTLKTYFPCSTARPSCTYNGVAFTVTSSTSGFVLSNGRAIPYQTSDGQWWLRFQGYATHSSVTGTVSWTISGIGGAPFYLGTSCLAQDTTGTGVNRFCSNSGADMVVYNVSATTGETVSFDVPITQKPTWAD